MWLSRNASLIKIYMVLCVDEASYLKELHKLGMKETPPWVGKDADATTHIFNLGGSKLAMVCISPNKAYTKHQVYALLVHEGVHIWRENCRMIGEHSPSEEFECYSIQHIAQELMTAYDTLTKRSKKRAVRPTNTKRNKRTTRRV